MPDATDSSKEVNLSDKPSLSIPGLFLSTPQPPLVPASCQTHRSSFESVNSTKRPFDQKVETGPFLINVSDDEDDAEMDVDMPAQPLTEQCELSPQKAAMSKEHGYVMEKPLRYDITQIPAVTPSRSSSHNSGIEDLASMNKKIEAMKRKIAEAEARKRTKLSRQMSPIGSQPNESSRDSGAPSPLLERSCTPCNDDSVLQTVAIAMP
ncbi:uncharacterized protein LOC120350982, partial [Nilaparvata lugens]|uniref:uncharacterized protein LOC120350982 n=1 Tax=Nilaparvata lugens TaxID=108931 RepID=UPI00193C9DF2